MAGTITVDKIQSDTSYNSTVNVVSALVVSNTATFSNTTTHTGAATFASTLGVTGATTLSSTLAVTGAITSGLKLSTFNTIDQLAIVTNTTWGGANPRVLVGIQKSSVGGGGLGIDASDNVTLFNSAGSGQLTVTSTGVTIPGTLGVTGLITATTAGISVPTSAAGTVYSATYTPTISNAANTTQTTAVLCRYTRVGNVVTVYGMLNLAVNTVSSGVSFELSLPIASNLTNANEDLSGVGVAYPSGTVSETYRAVGEVDNNTASFSGLGFNSSNHGVGFTFSYIVQ